MAKKIKGKKATLRQKRAIKLVVENHGNVSKAMRDAGYPATTAKNPSNLTNSKAWAELVEEALPDDFVLNKHKELFNSYAIEQAIFPLGPEKKTKDQKALSDEEITELYLEINCRVKKIVHSEQSRRVYFWIPDNKARKDALDMAYKIKNKYPGANRGTPPLAVQINFNEDREKYK